jgi:hypothetical protein
MEYDPTAIDPDEVKESQQEPTEDSGLQTPQPDQPIPTDQERFEKEQQEEQSASKAEYPPPKEPNNNGGAE